MNASSDPAKQSIVSRQNESRPTAETFPEETRWTTVRIAADDVMLAGELAIPAGARGIVLFAHGSGSSRHSPRNRYVARTIQAAGVATLLFDLLTREEEGIDDRDGHLRFDIGFLARRLEAATAWAGQQREVASLGIGYFGSSTGGAAALVAAAHLGRGTQAVVSRGGRPDLAGTALSHVQAPTLLIVGGRDDVGLELNQQASAQLQCQRELVVVPGATHLFEEEGALEKVARLAAGWFAGHLRQRERRRSTEP